VKTLQYWVVRLVLSTPAWAPFYAKLLDLGAPRLRRVALRNLELAGYPEAERRGIADGVFTSIGRLIRGFAFFPRLDRANVHEWIRYEGLENFTSAKARGRGVLVATAHLGNWELSAFAHAWMTAPMYVVIRPLDNPRIDALVERLRTLSGNRLIGKKELIANFWQGAAVTDNAVVQCIKEIRRALLAFSPEKPVRKIRREGTNSKEKERSDPCSGVEFMPSAQWLACGLR